MSNIDLRHEPALGRINFTTSNLQANRIQLLDRSGSPLLQYDLHMSENAKRVRERLTSVEGVKYLALADKLDRGDADQRGDEQDTLYEGFPQLVDLVIDLFNMVARRDDHINDLESAIDLMHQDAAGEDI